MPARARAPPRPARSSARAVTPRHLRPSRRRERAPAHGGMSYFAALAGGGAGAEAEAVRACRAARRPRQGDRRIGVDALYRMPARCGRDGSLGQAQRRGVFPLDFGRNFAAHPTEINSCLGLILFHWLSYWS